MNEMFPDLQSVLLTEQQVKEWIQEHEQIMEEIRVRQERAFVIEKKLQAAELLTGRPYLKEAMRSDSDSDDQVSMTDAAEQILRDADRLMFPKELFAELSKVPEFKAKLEANPNYLYTMMARLVRQKRVIKEGRKYGPLRKE